ncbi:MAG: RelA/SpoT family protein [Bacilli bacterium]|nr:RelA/SpoT family protein [Bacilli bacterium]MDY4618423.1 RelA/SpoT family protein [Bacilli bacterium]
MTFNYILNKIKNPDDIKDIKASYEYANSKLSGIMRKNGDTEISHCLEVANILIDLNVDKETIICAILHSVLDFNDIDEKEIVENFSLETYKIIFSLSKINNLEMVDDSESAALYLRKVMVGLSEDVRVLFIKLADRLHNMRTFDAISTERQKKVANETLSVLVPIAHRLGINSIKSELENLCLYYLKPDVYNDILEKLNATVDSLNNYLIEMQESICDLLNENEIKFEIKGRVKSVYSIYNKLSTGKKWDDIYDILALRIFVDKESDCYAVVGLIHSKFRPIPSRFKDYIAVPKENMYQSLHTTVFGPGGKFYEIQIRTYEMDEIAEKGIASHWSYKEKGTKKIQTYMEQKLEIYRSIIENSENDTDEVFNEVVGSNILGNLMYVFTPKGDVIELPEDATPIDFAYRVHSKVGDTMTGAIVNDIMVSINTPLHDGDICKILTNPNSTPSKEWLNIVKTTQAKDKIKAYFSKIDKQNYIERGKNILEKELRKRKIPQNMVTSQENLKLILKELKLKDLDDLYFSIGSYKYTVTHIVNIIIPKEEPNAIKKNINIKSGSDILIDGKVNILTHLAKCCNPVKGDEIVGVITKNDGISVHQKNCENIINSDEKMVSASWIENVHNDYICSIKITLSSNKNKLSDIIAKISIPKVYIISIETIDEINYLVKIKVEDNSYIDLVIKNVNKLRYVKDVKRV